LALSTPSCYDHNQTWVSKQIEGEYIMPIISLSAHFDGKQICLDEPFDLEPDTRLIVTVLSEQAINDEHTAWLILSGQRLKDAYGENEPEYSSDLVKEINLHYESICSDISFPQNAGNRCQYDILPNLPLR